MLYSTTVLAESEVMQKDLGQPQKGYDDLGCNAFVKNLCLAKLHLY